MGGDRASGRNRVVRKKIEMDDDKLIECVRRNPSLYELDHKNYGSGVYRAKTWKAIGAEIKRHPIFCKKRWGNIRDNYKKAVKKYNWRLSQGYTKLKKYKFFDKLDFLENQIEDNIKDDIDETTNCETSLEVKCEPDIEPQFNDRFLYDNLNQEQQQHQQYYDDYNINNINQPIEPANTIAQFEINQIEEDNRTDEFDNYSQADTRVSQQCEEEEEPDQQEKDETDEEYQYQVEKLPSKKFKITKNHPSTHLGLRKKRKLQESNDNCELSNATKSMRYIVERVEDDRFIERHPVDAFLVGIAPTLKSLPAYYLSLAKTQIYSIVQEYEMAVIMEKRNENHRI